MFMSSIWSRRSSQPGRGIRNEDLTAVTRRQDSRGTVQRRPEIVGVAYLRDPGVHGDSDLDAYTNGPDLGSQQVLDLFGRPDSVLRCVECGGKGVARVGEHRATMGPDRSPDQLVVTRQRDRH
jgi:hypothetical protein